MERNSAGKERWYSFERKEVNSSTATGCGIWTKVALFFLLEILGESKMAEGLIVNLVDLVR